MTRGRLFHYGELRTHRGTIYQRNAILTSWELCWLGRAPVTERFEKLENTRSERRLCEEVHLNLAYSDVYALGCLLHDMFNVDQYFIRLVTDVGFHTCFGACQAKMILISQGSI
jgi:hypothetical protein